MLKKICEILECRSPILRDQGVYFIQGGKVYFQDLENSNSNVKIMCELLTPAYLLFEANDQIFVTNDSNELLCTIKDKNVISSPIDLSGYKINFGKKNYLGIMVFYPERMVGLYNLITGNKFMSTNFTGQYIFENSIFGIGQSISEFNINDGTKLWEVFASQIDSESDRVVKCLGLYKDNVYVVLTSGTISAVNIKTHVVENKWRAFDKEYLNFETIATVTKSKIFAKGIDNFSKSTSNLIKGSGKIVGFEYGVYWEIDLNTKKMVAETLFPELQKYDISGCWSAVKLVNQDAYFFSDQSFSNSKNQNLS